jgi:hypothetical protein
MWGLYTRVELVREFLCYYSGDGWKKPLFFVAEVVEEDVAHQVDRD